MATGYYSNSIPYPPAFADFLQLETAAGNASLYGVQPVPAYPWAGATNPSALFVPGRLAWGGDGQGGYLERAFGTHIVPGQPWQSPVVRLALGHPATLSLQAYIQANGFTRDLADKMSPDVLAKFKQSVLVNLDGSLSYEDYSGNDGYTVCHWHPAVQAANRATVGQFVTNHRVDLLFEDQTGARGWQYDLNAASPTPYAYAAGMAAQAAEDSASLPLSTENGWDRVVNDEAQFCGMTWGLLPTASAPSWRKLLRDQFDPATWQVFPVAQHLAHDKLSMIHHDLGQFVTNDELLANLSPQPLTTNGYRLANHLHLHQPPDPDQSDRLHPRLAESILPGAQRRGVLRTAAQPKAMV